jgi:hypothetical protein
MQHHPKRRERGTFALTKVPVEASIRNLLRAVRPETGRVRAFALAEKRLNLPIPTSAQPALVFSTVFSTVVEILGNKPKD